MVNRRNRVFHWVGFLISLSALPLIFLNRNSVGSAYIAVAVGCLFGTLFGHTTLAAAWAAFGPGPIAWRIPLSLIWVTMLVLAVAVNMAANARPDDVPIFIGICLFAQWLLLQLPLGALAIGYGYHLRHTDDVARLDPSRSQFGIRQLIIITSMVGVIFGIGRLVVAMPGSLDSLGDGNELVFLFLAAAAVVISLPLVLATLMPRMVVPGAVFTLCFIGLATVLELPLIKSFRSVGPEAMEQFIAINASTSAVILVGVSIVRWSGYSLCVRSKRQSG